MLKLNQTVNERHQKSHDESHLTFLQDLLDGGLRMCGAKRKYLFFYLDLHR